MLNLNFAGNVGTGGAPVEGAAPASIDPLLTDRETASILGCNRSSVWRWASEGTLPKPLKIGGMARWKQSTIEAVIAKAQAEAEAA